MQNQSTTQKNRADIAKGWVAGLPPASFALVMATGIVSIASELLGMHWIAVPLFVLNIVTFVVLWALFALRAVVFPGALLADLRTHAKSPGFFTMVAGTSVLGTQTVLLTDKMGIAAGFWLFALLLWVVISYALFTAVIAQSEKPKLIDCLSGVWLVASVATQSIAVLGCMVAAHFAEHEQAILFVCFLFYCMGCMLYLNIIALIFYRLTFLPVEPVSITPPYWINMGATAIATQAGSTLLLHAAESPLLTDLVPFVLGFTFFFWAAGSWWIPLLVILWIWTVQRGGVVYSPMLWSAVFPLGMYTACTYQLAMATNYDGLLWLPAITVYIALLAWGLTFLGFLKGLIRALHVAARGVSASG